MQPRPHRLSTVVVAAVTLSTLALSCANGMPFGRRPPPSCSTVCAFGIEGVRTSLRDTQDGVDVTFVVVGDASELRRRAHSALETGTYPLRPESKALARRVHASIRDEEDGLVVHAVPIDPTQLESVREAFDHLLDDLQSGACD